MRARCPASSANLGPGFDALAIALTLYVEVTVEPAAELSIESTGEGSDWPRDHAHLAARVLREVHGHDNFHVTVDSEIPVSRGLGSSAALALAVAAASGDPADIDTACRFDGHAENAMASHLGGLVAGTFVDGASTGSRLPLADNWRFVVLVPDRMLNTKEARAALAERVPLVDATFNLGRMGLLLAGLASGHDLRASATDDRLHQPYRAKLFPEAEPLMRGLEEAGAAASCWSGAGPSILGICPERNSAEVRAAGEALLAQHGVAGRALDLDADRTGLVITAS